MIPLCNPSLGMSLQQGTGQRQEGPGAAGQRGELPQHRPALGPRSCRGCRGLCQDPAPLTATGAANPPAPAALAPCARGLWPHSQKDPRAAPRRGAQGGRHGEQHQLHTPRAGRRF